MAGGHGTCWPAAITDDWASRVEAATRAIARLLRRSQGAVVNRSRAGQILLTYLHPVAYDQSSPLAAQHQ
jgi:hypothetical protein